MRDRHAGKIEIQMTPMIDIVFQLLIFFLFTFKIIPLEGEIGVQMPPVASDSAPRGETVNLVERISIRLEADRDGKLTEIRFGQRALGNAPRQLTAILKESFIEQAGDADDVEVEIDANRDLQYAYVVAVTNAVMAAGIEKIDFTDPTQRGPHPLP